jgi:subtilisin family serine protease
VADPTVDPNAAAYVDDPNHPTSVTVGTLADLGADIVFAAGNCGPTPVAGCVPNAQRTIYGANSHPKVLTVGAVGLDQLAAGYSSRGTGHLTPQKPDIGAYSDFVGSTKFGATDSGTSAAAPVAAGVLATLRSSMPFDPANPSTFPAVLRDRLVQKAEPCAPNRSGFPNYDVGFGVVSARCF